MIRLLTAAQMRALEKAAIDSGAVTGRELMERAGQGVVQAVLAEWPELALTAHRAVVLCGPGNNGGDGFVVARLLKERGWEVEVFLLGDPEKLPPDARVNCERWMAMGGVRQLGARAPVLRCDLLVDALFGTGLARPLDLPAITGAIAEGRARIHRAGGHAPIGRVVSIDMPSGRCADSGRWLGEEGRGRTLRPDLVVTFHGPKVGHYLGPDAPPVRVADIGLSQPETPEGVVLVVGPRARLAKEQAAPAHREVATHKYSHGHALVLSGGPGRGGAARLAARAALRVGAGLVTLACPPAALAENAARLDAIMLRPVTGGAALAEILRDDRINALGMGPGLGAGTREAALVAAALATRRCTVLDADALTLLAGDPALFGALHEACVLTPHGGEFARLFPDIAEKLAAPATRGPAYSKVDATREAAARTGCVVLLKGPDTVIADPAGNCAVNSAACERAAPWLATAGSGDVLAGMIAGLLARGFDPMQAAETAAWLHVEAARSFGPGLIAEDLPEELPKVFRALGI